MLRGGRIVALCAVVLAAPPARAQPDVHLLAGLSGMATTGDLSSAAGGAPSVDSLESAELDLTLRADLRRLADRVDVRLDYLDREGLIGLGIGDATSPFGDGGLGLRPGLQANETVHQLRELSARITLAPRLHLTVGRIVTPGGFWLIADGAKLDVDYAQWLSQSLYGGLRALTSGFRETHLTDDPTLLPLAGTALRLRTRHVDAEALFTYAQDRVDFSNQLAGNALVLEHHVENDYFLQASIALRPTDDVLVIGGVRLGTRYDLRWNAGNFDGPTQIGAANLSSVSAWLVAEWRYSERLRLQYMLNEEHITVFQSQLIGIDKNYTSLDATEGDFLDQSLRVSGRIRGSMLGAFTYRLRFRGSPTPAGPTTDIEHHLVGELRDSNLYRHLGYRAAADVTIIEPSHIFFAPDVTTFVRGVYAVDATYITQTIDARLGIHYIDQYDSCGNSTTCSASLLSYQYNSTGLSSLPTNLFPFVIDADKIAVATLFYTGDNWFGGLDVEESLVSWQLRAMLQVGYAR